MEPGSTLSIVKFLPEIYLTAILIFLSGFFSSSETALFSLTRETRKELSRNGTFLNKIILYLLNRPRSLLITLLLGNMLVNVAYFSVAYKMAKSVLIAGHENASLISGIIGVSSLLIIIIFGEVIPKNIAVTVPVRVSKTFVLPILIFEKVFLPISIPLDFITDKISYLFSKGNNGEEKNITVDEQKMIVGMGKKHGLVDEAEHTMINAVLDFQEKSVKDVMVPRVDMAVYDVADPVDGFLDIVRQTKYTKIPVYNTSPDTIIGVIHSKDVFFEPDVELRKFVKPVLFIPATKTIESLLRKFRREHKQLAIVLDEYGGTAGLVALEDILEEIVGEIKDEHDKHEELIKKTGENRYYLPGNISIRDWSDYFEVELEPTDFDTVGGLVISLLDDMPKKGDTVDFRNMRFTVDKIKKRRIAYIVMEVNP